MITLPPDEIRTRPQWVTWKYVDGRKVPFTAHTGKPASSTDPATWSTYEQAARAAQRRHHAGVGYVFSADDPNTGIDLDDCIADGELEPWARTIVDTMQTYTEISPSGTGVKMWVIGDVPSSVKMKQVEIYSQGRYFTFTGQQLPGTPDTIRDAQPELMVLYESLKPKQAPRPDLAGTLPQPATNSDHIRRWCLAALEGEQQKMQAAGDGERHKRRYDSAHALAGLLHSGGVSEDEITGALAINFGRDVAGAMKTIADGIKAGRERPRTIPAPQLRASEAYTVDESTPEGAAREIARLRARVAQLEEWREWALKLVELPTDRLSPAAKVVAFSLYPAMKSRDENGIDEPREVYIGDPKNPKDDGAARKTGLSAGTFGARLQELACAGAIVRVEDRRANGNRRILIQTTAAFSMPEAWGPEEPRDHGGARPGAGRPIPETCPTCPPETSIEEITATTKTYHCRGCAKPLHVDEPKIDRRTWRHRPHDGLWEALPSIKNEPNTRPNIQLDQILEDGSFTPITQDAPRTDDTPESPNNQVECWVIPAPVPEQTIIRPDLYRRHAAERKAAPA